MLVMNKEVIEFVDLVSMYSNVCSGVTGQIFQRKFSRLMKSTYSSYCLICKIITIWRGTHDFTFCFLRCRKNASRLIRPLPLALHRARRLAAEAALRLQHRGQLHLHAQAAVLR